ncbi:MAG TPA: hypothetical protein VGL71_08655 [Urbifossiella sp.]
MSKTFTFAVCLGLLVVPAIRADESGPKAGEKVAKMKAYGVVGAVEKKEADFAAERKNAPTIYLFVAAEEGGIPVGGRPAVRFMKKLDEEIGKCDGAAIIAIWLGDNAFDKHKDYLPRIAMSLKFEHTQLAAFDGQRSGPDGWAINGDTHVTAVVVNKGRVAKSFAFTSVNETDVRPVLAELKKSMK